MDVKYRISEKISYPRDSKPNLIEFDVKIATNLNKSWNDKILTMVKLGWIRIRAYLLSALLSWHVLIN